MSINKQALREAAEKATPGKWKAFIHTASRTCSVHTPRDKRCDNVVKWSGFDGQKNAEANAKFIAAANPATVLALLDDLDGKDGRIKELDSQRALAFMACNRWRDKCVDAEAKLEAAEKRIAELEARTIKLPQRYSMLYRTEFDAPYDSHMAFKESDVIEALAAAGITAKGDSE